MASFANNAVTDTGRILLASAQAGDLLDVTRIVIGSGYLPSGTTVNTIKDVVAPVKSLSLNKKEKTPDGKAIFGAAFSNKDIQSAFYLRELAIYARLITKDSQGEYTVQGEEVLYSYGNAGASADLIPAYSTETVVEKQMDIVSWVGNETKINLSIESGVFITQEQLEEALKNLNFATTATYTATLTAEGWSASAPYTQTVAVTEIKTTDNPIVDVVLSGTTETAENELEAWGSVSRIQTQQGNILATCFNDKPAVALNLQIKVVK